MHRALSSYQSKMHVQKLLLVQILCSRAAGVWEKWSASGCTPDMAEKLLRGCAGIASQQLPCSGLGKISDQCRRELPAAYLK
jgi:hypothetical protein